MCYESINSMFLSPPNLEDVEINSHVKCSCDDHRFIDSRSLWLYQEFITVGCIKLHKSVWRNGVSAPRPLPEFGAA